jgi:hypothetical protein
MREPIGTLVELGEGQCAIAARDRQPIRKGVGGVLKKIGYVERHAEKLERVIVWRKAWP